MDVYTRQQPGRARVLLARLVVFASVLSTSCALVVHGRSQVLTVTTDPAGARVYVGTQLMGATPAQIPVRRSRNDAVLRIEKDGYEPAEVRLRSTINPWVGADAAIVAHTALVGGQGLDTTADLPMAIAQTAAVTLGIDFATGAAYRLSPSHVRVKLVPVQRPHQ